MSDPLSWQQPCHACLIIIMSRAILYLLCCTVQELPAAASVSREGSKRPSTKPLRSKRNADAMADGEVGFPMPSRPRVSLALPGGERPLRHHRNDAVAAALGPLPDSVEMTSQV